MAYADFKFYQEKYFGNVMPESDFVRMAERASDWIDTATFERLAEGLPTSERAQIRVKKAVCALAEAMYRMELAQIQADTAAQASGSSSVSGAASGTTGIVTSKSSGSESISFATPQQIGASAKEWSASYAAAGDPVKTNMLLYDTAKMYLTGVMTDEGIPLLYAGMR